MIRLTSFDPLAALHLTLDFGHDTDSYAQVLGAMMGAVHGMNIWEKQWQQPVRDRLLVDYGESLEQWVDELSEYATRWGN